MSAVGRGALGDASRMARSSGRAGWQRSQRGASSPHNRGAGRGNRARQCSPYRRDVRRPSSRNESFEYSFPKDRQWSGEIATTLPMDSDTRRFTVMAYNLLADSLAMENQYLYRSSIERLGRKILDWRYREARLLDEILHHSPDIVCLQELDEPHYKYSFAPRLQSVGYHGIYKRRSGNSHSDGVATFVKTSSFKIVEHMEIEYRLETDTDRDNVGVIVIVERSGAADGSNKSVQQRMCVANTHLLYNPKRGLIKIAQFRALANKMRLLIQQHQSMTKSVVPAVLCGDFNCLPNSFVYHYVRTGVADLLTMSEHLMSGQQGGKFFGIDVADSAAARSRLSLKSIQTIDPEIEDVQPLNRESTQKRAFSGTTRKTNHIIDHPFDFTSVYGTHDDRGVPLYSTCVDGRRETVDYVWVGSLRDESDGSGGSTCRGGVVPVRYLKPPVLTTRNGSTPDETLPSDHVSLLAELIMWTSQC
ncbi:Endonuclease/exonuclease/phosphatase [Cladochytrium replicatum]|nr:Endonuclease/exonuclease/phosphatase [Cladochytrium replicatum]